MYITIFDKELNADKFPTKITLIKWLMEVDFKGTGVAIVTPFNEDKSIDYIGLSNLIEYLIDGGVEFLV